MKTISRYATVQTTLLLLGVWWAISPVWAQNGGQAERGDLDSFYIGLGTSNVTQGDTIELGFNIQGGLRLGLIGNYFGEIGYGAIEVEFDKDEAGVARTVLTRTTGPFVAVGGLFPVRAANIGFRGQLSFLNKLEHEIINKQSQGVIEEFTDDINFLSAMAFTQLAKSHEFGFRIDIFESNRANVKNSIGIYYAFHFLF